MKRMITRVRCLALTFALTLCNAYTSFALEFNAGSKVTEMTTQLKDVASKVITFVSVIIGVIAAVMLAWNFFKRAKSDGQANDALGSWFWGLAFTLIGLQLIDKVLLR